MDDLGFFKRSTRATLQNTRAFVIQSLAAALFAVSGFGAAHAENSPPDPTAQTAPPPATCLWTANKTALYQIGTDTGQIFQTVPLKDARLLAMNGSDCGVWTIAGKQLYRFDAKAVQTQQIALQTFSKQIGDATQLIVDAFDNSIWLADNQTLFHISPTAQLLASTPAPGAIRTMALALDQSLWVLGNKQLWHYSAQSALLSSQDLSQPTLSEPKLFALDSLLEVLWLAGEKQLTPLDLHHPDQPAVSIKLPEVANALTLDPLTNALWVATDKNLLSYGPDGIAGQTVELKALGLDKPNRLAFDPATRSLWLGTDQALGRFTAQGAYVGSLQTSGENAKLAAPAFVLMPTLSLIRPPANVLTNNPAPTLSYGFGAACNNQPCGFAPDAFSQYNLTVALNKAPVGPFQFNTTTGQASHTPGRLPEGPNTLVAQVRDEFGHASNIANDLFTIDTIAPRFLSVSPVEGSLLNTPAVTLQGTVDDMTAIVLLNGARTAAKTTASGANLNFSIPATLKEGLNTFNLSAWDMANNSSALVLHLTLDTTPPKILNVTPANGTKFATALVTLAGSVDDAGATVTLANLDQWNGTGANPAGQNFSWSLTLKPGANAFRINATDKTGNAAGYDLILTYIPPPPPVPVAAKISVGALSNGTVTLTGAAGAVGAGLNVTVANTRTQQSVTVIADVNGGFIATIAAEGGDALTVKAIADGGEAYSEAVDITVAQAGLKVYYLHSDHLNTPRVVTDEQNRVVWRNTPLAEPFGTVAPEQDPDGNGVPFTLNLRFPGQYFDRETGLNYNYFRDYDPSTGRYIESDPIGLKGGINTYTYVGGNPISRVDPEGLRQQGVDPRELPRVPGEPRCSGGDSSCAAGLPPTRPLTCTESCMLKEASLVCSPMAAGISYVGGVVLGIGTQVVCRVVAYQICKDRCDQDKCNSNSNQ